MSDSHQVSDVLDGPCPAREILDHITSRWGLLVLTALYEGPHRFAELRHRIGGVSEKMLSQTLRTLVHDGFVSRTVEPSAPPRVSYALTGLGRDLAAPLKGLIDWISVHAEAILADRVGD